MATSSALLLGIGTALPAYSVSQEDAATLARQLCCEEKEQERSVQVLYRRALVESRGSVLLGPEDGRSLLERQSLFGSRPTSTGARMVAFEEHAGALAAAAAREALSRSAVAPADLSDLVTVSCSGFFAPGVDVALVRDLGLDPGTGRTHVGFMGCHGALNGLRVARGLCAARPRSHTLLVAVELCSLHFQYGWEPERIVANALFADGAAACVLGPSLGTPSDREADSWSLLDVGSHVFPGTEDLMTWKVGDHGFVMSLSPAVPEVLESSLRPWVEEWLSSNGLGLGDIASWAIHPGGPRILTSVEKALTLPREACALSREVLARHGNMSSPTVLFLLERLRARRAPLPCVALAFGPGLVAEAALFG